MSKERSNVARLEREQAMAKVMDKFVPQLFSGPEILSNGASDAGGQDYWMLTNMPAELLVPLVGLQTIANADSRDDIKAFIQTILRGLKGIGGFTVKQGESIALGLGGGVGRKTVKRPGWAGRNITNRGWKEKAEDEGAEVEQ